MMLRSIFPVFVCFLAGTASYAEGQDAALAESDAAADHGVAATEAAPAAQDEAPEDEARESDPVAADATADLAEPNEARTDADDGVISTAIVQGERFRYSMTLRRAGTDMPGIVCSYNRRTGGLGSRRYCRTDEMAERERVAAREFLEDAARNRGN